MEQVEQVQKIMGTDDPAPNDIYVDGTKVTADIILIADMSFAKQIQALDDLGRTLAAAERERMRAEALYRKWRAATTQDILNKDPKLAEWKTRAQVEQGDRFLMYKEALAKAEHAAVAMRWLVEAVRCLVANGTTA